MNGHTNEPEPRTEDYKIRLRTSEKRNYQRVARELDVPMAQWMRAVLNRAVEDFDKRAK